MSRERITYEMTTTIVLAPSPLPSSNRVVVTPPSCPLVTLLRELVAPVGRLEKTVERLRLVVMGEAENGRKEEDEEEGKGEEVGACRCAFLE